MMCHKQVESLTKRSRPRASARQPHPEVCRTCIQRFLVRSRTRSFASLRRQQLVERERLHPPARPVPPRSCRNAKRVHRKVRLLGNNFKSKGAFRVGGAFLYTDSGCGWSKCLFLLMLSHDPVELRRFVLLCEHESAAAGFGFAPKNRWPARICPRCSNLDVLIKYLLNCKRLLLLALV